MAQNPLQQYFRQPKIFISLPSHGVYNKLGSIDGDVNRMPVFGMTGMDEILMKTPDALLTGDSTVKVVNSCCPSIKDPWDLSNIDLDLVLAAIRIATYGSDLTVLQLCKECGADHEYTLNLNKLIDHYSECKFDSKLVLDDLSVTFRPLNYKQSTDFSLKNFQLQQQLGQITSVEDEVERKKVVADLFQKLSMLQTDVLLEQIEKIDTGKVSVTERSFISEWLSNCDSVIVSKLKKHIELNQKTWAIPSHQVNCENCGAVIDINIELDQSSFFGPA